MNVVLLHGFCENDSVWHEFASNLPSRFNYYVPNYSELTSCQRMEDYARILKNELEDQQIFDAVLIGHSMGGYIALAFAELYPERVLGLGLFHSSPYADSTERKETRLKAIQYIVKNGAKEYIEDFLPNMFNNTYKAENKVFIQKKIEEYTLKITEEALIAALLVMRDRPDRSPILEQAAYPTMFIGGGHDKYISEESVFNQTRLSKRVNSLILHEVAHAGMLEKPELTATFVANFLFDCHAKLS